MDSETPFAGGEPDSGDDVPYKWLDEWLCEYVDGTMDPSLEAVFEQYVEANPELKAHVQRLKKTRKLLCECSLPPPSSPDAPPSPPPESDRSSPAPSSPDRLRDRPFVVLGMISSVTAALVIGVFIGATMVNPNLPAVSSSDVQRTTPTRSVASPQSPPAYDALPVLFERHATNPPDSTHTSSFTSITLP